MAEPGKNTYGRADRVAAWNLLARIYLNAEVYTSTPRWDDAMTYAEKVIINNGYYHLNTTGATNPVTGEKYTGYQMLFLADNNRNGAQYENLLVGLTDGETTKKVMKELISLSRRLTLIRCRQTIMLLQVLITIGVNVFVCASNLLISSLRLNLLKLQHCRI